TELLNPPTHSGPFEQHPERNKIPPCTENETLPESPFKPHLKPSIILSASAEEPEGAKGRIL
ncbi:hypothetical protein K0M31_014058, partial [Melipona bicolor]